MGFSYPEELVEGGLPKIIVAPHQNPPGCDDRLFFFKSKKEIEKRKKCLVVARDKKGQLLINPVKEAGVTVQSTANNAHLRFFILNKNKKPIYDRRGDGVSTRRCDRFVLESLTHLSIFSLWFKDYQSWHMEGL